MRRRTLLVGTLPLLAGCLTSVSGESSDDPRTTDEPFGTVTFERRDPGSVRTGPVSEVESGVSEDAPVIAVDGESVRVQGALAVGSSECKEVALGDVTYESGVLTVEIVDGKSANHPDNRLFGGGCSDDMSVDGYEVGVRFDEAPPTRVVAAELNVDGTRATAEYP
ncbi:hypothetical protein [Halomarina ordinaria]|uniref:Lipoprotein n=1 Tax=Halomarina ordinaria TaxID=3033939 RepID=A0ABD5UD28_9EURY|nr:hypothetical protein [Halomarina sp. PSRA2]